MSSHITTQQYYVTLKVFNLENTKYPDTKTQTYFSSLFRSFAITIIPFISFSEQHPQFIKWNYLIPTCVTSIMAPLCSLCQHKPNRRQTITIKKVM